MWYLECQKLYAPAEEQSEKTSAMKTGVEDLSDDEEEEEVQEQPIDKKTKKKQAPKVHPITKKARKGKASGATSGHQDEVAYVQVEVVPVASSQGPPILQSSSTVVFAPSQWQTASTLRSITTDVQVTCLILQYSIRDAIEYLVKNNQPSPQQIQILDFVEKVIT